THSRRLKRNLSSNSKEIARCGRSLFVSSFTSRSAVDTSLRRANMRQPLKSAPVAQRIEHLPCWSLNGEVRHRNPLSGRPCMRERPESLRYFDPNVVQVTILEDWVIRRKPV